MTKCTKEFEDYVANSVVPEMSYLAESNTTEAREGGMIRIGLSHWNFVKGGWFFGESGQCKR